MASSDPWDGTIFLVGAPDVEQAHGRDYLEHQSTRKSMEFANNKEHETLVTPMSTVLGGGEHSNGSAVAYVASSAPTKRPDGATALADNDIDKGRLWNDRGTVTRVGGLKYWDGSGWLLIGVSSGAISAYAGPTVPDGWLLCDGTTDVSVTANPEYAGLYAAIGITYGGVDSNNFDLPDLRGYFVRGLSTDNTVDPDTRALGDIQLDSIEAHTHGLGTLALQEGTGGSINRIVGGGASTTTSSTGGDETRPKNMALNYIIKY